MSAVSKNRIPWGRLADPSTSVTVCQSKTPLDDSPRAMRPGRFFVGVWSMAFFCQICDLKRTETMARGVSA